MVLVAPVLPEVGEEDDSDDEEDESDDAPAEAALADAPAARLVLVDLALDLLVATLSHLDVCLKWRKRN